MSTQEEAREVMAQSRQQEQHVEKSMLSRSQAEIERLTDDDVEEEARAAMAAKRQHDEHIHQSMLGRTAKETGLSKDAASASSE